MKLFLNPKPNLVDELVFWVLNDSALVLDNLVTSGLLLTRLRPTFLLRRFFIVI
jgi:hypothetical protein